jgi:hypothetical protein
MGRLRAYVLAAFSSFLGAGLWHHWHHWFWELVRAWFYERGFHVMNPVLFGITAEQFFHWGPTLAFVGVGGVLFYKTWPRGPSVEQLPPQPSSSDITFDFSTLTEAKEEPSQTQHAVEDIMTAADIEPHQILEAMRPSAADERPKLTKYKNKRLLDVTPKFLMDLYEGRPALNANALAKEYRGKWIVCSGNAENISTYGSGMFYLSFGLEGKLSTRRIILRFNGAKWKDRLLTLPKDQPLTVVGKIEEIEKFSLTLIDCAIVE